MRKQILGWAVIFTVTILLSACASHDAQVSNYNKMSGADATTAQYGEQEQALANIDDTFLYSMALPDERETQLDQIDNDQLWSAYPYFVSDAFLEERESQMQTLTSHDDTFTHQPSFTGEREFQLDQREVDLEWSQDAVAVAHVLLDEREMRLVQREIDLEFREDTAAVSRAFFAEHNKQLAQREGLGIGTAQLAGISSTPTGAKPGRCYARITVPGEFLTVTDKMLTKQAGTKVEVIPARYETVSEQVMIERGSVQIKAIPAKYRTVTERVMIEPARKYLVHVPAQFEVTLEQVMVTPATTTWKKGTGPLQRVDESTGEILCLVETPAQYQTVSKRVLKSAATTREVESPPTYETIERREIVTPAKTVMVDIPAKYKTVQVTKLVMPEYQKSTPIPARFQTVSKRIKVTEDRMEWQEILCETNMTQSKASNIQRALAHAGFSPGPIDGIIGKQTMGAVNDFQKANNLTVARYLTVDTLTALGLEQ